MTSGGRVTETDRGRSCEKGGGDRSGKELPSSGVRRAMEDREERPALARRAAMHELYRSASGKKRGEKNRSGLGRTGSITINKCVGV